MFAQLSNKRILLIFIVLMSLLGTSNIIEAEGTYSNIGTTDGADGDQDALNFAQGRVWTIDKYGKYIWITQRWTGSTQHWTWSNNNGSTWTEGAESYTFLTRASVGYDSINDKLHVIWAADGASDGIIYRRYGITRDGSNNITAINREDNSNINLQLDISASRNLSQPVGIWVNDGTTNGSLIAVWSKSGTSLTEIRASKRTLSLSAADGVAGNWVALDGTGDTFSTDPPAVQADKIYGSTTTGNAEAAAIIRGGSGSRKDDIYVFVAEAVGANSRLLAYRGVWSSGSTNWSGGWQSPVTMGQVNNTGGGYNLKYQLISKPVLDSTNDRLYIAWARWKDGVNGDTVSMGYLNSSDTASSVIDVYSALGTHAYAPTIDIAYDATMNQIYAAYIESTTNGTNGSIDYKTYDGTTLSAETRFYTSPGGTGGANGGADIPVLYENRYDGKLLFGFRVNGSLPPVTITSPHIIKWGYVTLPTPTPTPTPTATPTSVASIPAPPVCSKETPSGIPFLSAKTSSQYQITLTLDIRYAKYVLQYGSKSGVYPYGASEISGSKYLVNALAPGITYYFRVAPLNGCAVGSWSKEVSARTNSFVTIFNSVEPTINPFIPHITSPITPQEPIKLASPTPAPTPLNTDQLEANNENSQSMYLKILGAVLGIPTLILILTGAYRKMKGI